MSNQILNDPGFAPNSPVKTLEDSPTLDTSSDIDEDWLIGKLTGKPPSELEVKFACRWTQLYPEIDLEVEGLLIPKRKYRIDFFHRKATTAIELNGYRDHSSKIKVQRDYRKIQILQAMGWAVFPLSWSDVDKDEVLADIANTIRARLAA